MCNNTKKKIAAALCQLMDERSFERITVQNLMDVTQMKRQSFYYHFRDTRDVLMWICRQEVLEPLAASALGFESWIFLAMELFNQNRGFYRKLLKSASLDFIQEFMPILEPRMLSLLYPGRTAAQLSDNQRFLLDFTTEAVCIRIVRFVDSRDSLSPSVMRERVEYLIRALSSITR